MPNKILILLGDSYACAVADLGEIVTNVKEFINRPQDFKLVMFTGGADVTPSFYGHTSPEGQCMYSVQRDYFEQEIFNLAREHGILMTGICRGVQFLNVMSGGTMIHHLDRHTGADHKMQLVTGHVIEVNTLHHQMIIPPPEGIIIGWADERRSNVYIGDKDLPVEYHDTENEAVIFPHTKAFGVQYHPEMMLPSSDGYKFYHQFVRNALELPWEKFIDAYTTGHDVNDKTAAMR